MSRSLQVKRKWKEAVAYGTNHQCISREKVPLIKITGHLSQKTWTRSGFKTMFVISERI